MQIKLPPANRIVAFAGPYIALASGALASFLVVHVQILGSLGLGQDKLAHGIAYGVTAGLGSVLPHLGMQRWLDGHQKFTNELSYLINNLNPGLRQSVVKALPVAEGDILKALASVASPAVTKVPASASPADESGDGSGDIEQPSSLIDVTGPPLDPAPPAGSLGDDSVHAPPPPPDAGAGVASGAEAGA